MKFSVLISVYHKEKPDYLYQALESITSQTLLPNQVVIVKDGPLTEELDSIINDFQNSNSFEVTILSLKTNQGLGQALANGLLKCKYNIVARMDTDDIALNSRFMKQIPYFIDRNLDILGSNIAEFEKSPAEISNYRNVPTTQEQIYQTIKSRNPFNHMTVIYKRDSVLKAGSYKHMSLLEDYYLWARMYAMKMRMENLPEVTVYARAEKDLFERRGGLKYGINEIKFQRELLRLKVINFPQFLKNITIRFTVRIMPSKVRKQFYQRFLRND